MTRPKNPEAIEQEARIQEAIIAIKNKQHTAHTAAIAFNVPRRTLYRRVKENTKPRNLAHERDQILTHAEERELVRWITRLTITGYPPRYKTLREMAEEIRKRRVKDINEEGMQLIEYDRIGKDWVRRFLLRHSELASVRARSIDAVRVKDTSPERLQQWFAELEKVLAEYNIKPENIYNMDESGFAIGEKEAGKVIINAEVRQKFQAKPGRQEWVTVVECICADGTVVPPLVIFKAENLSIQWIPANINGHWRFSCNSKGWTSNKHGVQWLRRCFEPATREKAAGEYRLLICDGHDSHITGEYIGHCMDNNIILMILPLHSSHMTQPLDVGVFGPMKKHMAVEIDLLIRTGIPRIQKVEWLTAFVAAHNRAVCNQNILGGFCGTGIHPFSPEKVLNRIDVTPDSKTTIRPTTPPNGTTPFNESVLTSSPVDINAVHRANVALSAELDSGKPLSTPAKTFIKCQGRSVERLYASNSILKHDNAAKDAVIGARKHRLSGKRKSIDGKNVMTAEELVAIRDAEEVTKKREVTKKGGTQRKRNQTRKESSDESEEEISSTGDEVEPELLDCIAVEMQSS